MRLKYIDCLKGALILFVVYYHVLWLGLKYKISPTKEIFDLVCMQAFFFVSGFVSLKQFADQNLEKLSAGILGKSKTLLLPTVVMFFFCCLYYNLSIKFYLLNEFKTGYWFTYVLFILFALHATLLFLLNRLCRSSVYSDFITLTVSFSMFVVYGRVYKWFPFDTLRLLSVQFVCKYYVFFVLGYLMKKYFSQAECILRNGAFRVFILTFACLPFVDGLDIVKTKKIVELLISVSQVMLLFLLFRGLPMFNNDGFLSRQLSFWGKHTMEVYFIHYYFLFNMPMVMRFINEQDEYCFRGPGNAFVVEFLSIIPVAIVLVYLSIGVRRIFEISPGLSRIFFGPFHR